MGWKLSRSIELVLVYCWKDGLGDTAQITHPMRAVTEARLCRRGQQSRTLVGMTGSS